ncbi:unnamed protein product [Urochloa decumbens]|uniref:MATH domain-containing protein n=1 Tax=Urochloa decumbens TaxID=240449 RepID=A0ABC9F113_9POAL
MSPLSYVYAPLRADADDATAAADDDDTSTLLPPETLTVSTVSVAAVGGVGHHLFKVEGYSHLKKMHGDTGSYIESGEFTAGGHAWKILCYPNGCGEEGAGHVSLYLMHTGGGSGAAGAVVHAEFDFELVQHHHGGAAAALWPPRSRSVTAPPVAFKDGQETLGYAKFIAAEDLERSRFLDDDCFAVRCSVTVVEEMAAAEEDVTAEDMDRVGVVCPCKDEACEFKHERPAQTLWEEFALFCRFICGEASS